jgi:guanylate kinase
MHSKIFCIVGGSGSGKDTIKEQLNLPYVVSYRTRPIRKNEVDGVHGHFVQENKYISHKLRGLIAAETLYNGYRYWTTKDQFKPYLDNQAPVIYVVDGEGVNTLREVFPSEDVVAIFIDVNSEILESRMRSRGDSEENIHSRIQYFKEIADKDKSICNYVVENNGEIAYTICYIYQIIMKEIF